MVGWQQGRLRLAGVLLKLAYLLRRHLWLAWPMSRWLGVLAFAGTVMVAFRFRPLIWPALLPALSLLAYIVLLVWANRRGYVGFVVDAGAISPRSEQAGRAPGPKESIPVRASGWFTVEGKERYLVDIDADLSVASSGERIIMGRVQPSRFLLVGRRSRGELGWWYLFLRPETFREVQVGKLHFGRRPTAALRLVYDSDREARQAFIASADVSAVARVWDGFRDDLGGSILGAEPDLRRPGSG